jgi:hypothetical protein
MVLRPALSAGNAVARAEPERATIVRTSFKTGGSDRGGRAALAGKSQPMAIKTPAKGSAKTGAKFTAKPMAKSTTAASKPGKSAARPVIVKKARH